MSKLDFLGEIGGPATRHCQDCGCDFPEDDLENCPECGTGPYCDDCLATHLCGEDQEEDFTGEIGAGIL